MAYRYVNSRGVQWYLHGREWRTAAGTLWSYRFDREVRADDALEDLPLGHAVVERRGLAREPVVVPEADAERIAREHEEGAPEWAAWIVEMVECAFGGLPPREAYWPLVALLGKRSSFRGLADLLCLLFDVEWAKAYHDALAKDGVPASATEIERVRTLLEPCGYDHFLEE